MYLSGTFGIINYVKGNWNVGFRRGICSVGWNPVYAGEARALDYNGAAGNHLRLAERGVCDRRKEIATRAVRKHPTVFYFLFSISSLLHAETERRIVEETWQRTTTKSWA
ncbi:MAG: hypothetical protein JWN49_240 [Parcubacteria group bacterium]|nr:hypothetical protein [Parcubacteria group bacterium]